MKNNWQKRRKRSPVTSRNKEEQLLQELWKVGNKEQQHALAHMLVKLAE